MTRPLAYIETIRSIKPIIGSDLIQLATILGFDVIIKKNEFQVGDKVLYIETDSLLPNVPAFNSSDYDFLRSKKFKVKIAKIRGAFSYGLVLPLSIITEINPALNIANIKIGDDLTEALGISQFNSEIDDQLIDENNEKPSWLIRKFSFVKWKLFGIKPQKSSGFPTHLCPKTNETRVQRMQGLLERCVGQSVYISEKCEGSSASYIYTQPASNWLGKLFNLSGTFLACSRNNVVFNSSKGRKLENTSTHTVAKLAIKYDLQSKLQKLNRNIAIQAEQIGGKIQSNIYKLANLELRIFSIYDLDKKEYFSYKELCALTKQLELPLVPIIDTNIPLINDVNYYLNLAKGKSKINAKTEREGLVIRSMDSSFSFKAINPNYLLAHANDL